MVARLRPPSWLPLLLLSALLSAAAASPPAHAETATGDAADHGAARRAQTLGGWTVPCRDGGTPVSPTDVAFAILSPQTKASGKGPGQQQRARHNRALERWKLNRALHTIKEEVRTATLLGRGDHGRRLAAVLMARAYAAASAHEGTDTASLNTWARRAPQKVLFRKQAGSNDVDLVVALAGLAAVFPNATYFAVVHDDTYVLMRNFLCALASLDRKAVVLGGLVHCKGPDFACASRARVKATLGGWPNGGAGVVATRRLLEGLRGGGKPLGSRLLDCARSYGGGHIAASDVTLACCIADFKRLGVVPEATLEHIPSLSSGSPGALDECQCGADDPDDERDFKLEDFFAHARERKGGGKPARRKRRGPWIGAAPAPVVKRCTLGRSAPIAARASFHHVNAPTMYALEALQTAAHDGLAGAPPISRNASDVPQLDLYSIARAAGAVR